MVGLSPMIKNGFNIKTIRDKKISGRKVLVRVDFNVSLLDGISIADDARIRQTIPTLLYLLKNNNKLILVSHLDRPEKRDPKYSLKMVAKHLQTLVPMYKVILVNDFLSEKDKAILERQKENEIILLENIRFYPGEKANDKRFSKELAGLADVFVNDGFGVCHRSEASIVGIPKYLPSYAGLLLEKEIETIARLMRKPKKPVVAIIGGAKISTKIAVLSKLLDMADYLLIGGALANTMLLAQGYNIGKSVAEPSEKKTAVSLFYLAAQKNAVLVLPDDAVAGFPQDKKDGGEVVSITNVPKDKYILDIGPLSEAKFGTIIAKAGTIIWNGPVGYTENKNFARGTDFLYYAIAQNEKAFSVVGGGDTLAAISHKEYLDKITHVSTGGGAMLEFIEKGTLPGIEALRG